MKKHRRAEDDEDNLAEGVDLPDEEKDVEGIGLSEDIYHTIYINSNASSPSKKILLRSLQIFQYSG
jgi:hypothetical protein